MKIKANVESDIAEILEIDQSTGVRKIPKPWLIAVILAALLVVIILIFWIGSSSSSAVRYKTEEVKQGNLTVIVTATGILKPTNKVDVGSELSGIIKSVKVDYNDRVKRGQILATLDTSKLEAQVKQSKAALESAQAKVLQTQATIAETRTKLAQLKKVRELSNGKVPSQSDMDAAQAALERALADDAAAKAAVTQAQAVLDANKTDFYKAVIRSPINGIVLARNVESGQTVAASFETPILFTLAEDLKKMELHVNVDEADVGHIQEGQMATFTVSAYANRIFDAKIIQARYDSSTTSGVVTYETVLKVDNSDLTLRPGMTATADITVKKSENVILIPNAALRFTPPVQEEEKPSAGLVGSLLPRPPGSASQQGKNAIANKKEQNVWILESGQLSSVSITVGSTDGSMTEVLEGDIQPGMMVVVDTVSSVK
jgi:HlyD family secretion protein